jgi:hypothetical protein
MAFIERMFPKPRFIENLDGQPYGKGRECLVYHLVHPLFIRCSLVSLPNVIAMRLRALG